MSKDKLKILIIPVVVIIIFAVIIINPDVEYEPEYSVEKFISCNLFDMKDFMSSVSDAKEINTTGKNLKGGVTNHHLLADYMISSFYKTVKKNPPDIIILIGPNHKRIGKSKIHTGRYSWATSFGTLETEESIVQRLIMELGADENLEILEKEHAIYTHIPYIKYYIPTAKVVPIILHGNMSIKESKELARELFEAVKGKNYFVAGSIDFSHYLSVEEADMMDEITIQAIKDKDINRISFMGNDNIDSPASMIVILEMMRLEGSENMIVADHNNSAKISNSSFDYTTSYFELFFYKDS